MTLKFPTSSRENGCVICGKQVDIVTASWHKKTDVHLYANACKGCGFLQIIDNPWKYKDKGFTENSTSGPRVGSVERPGREFHMCKLALSALDQKQLSIFVLGSGLSKDYLHIQNLDAVAEVYASDFSNFSNLPNFIPIEEQGRRKFDVVLACEVIEHFENPSLDWRRLASNMHEDSIAVLSSNLYDDTPLEKHWYPYIPGHVAYYTGESIMELAKQNDLYVDFRFPLVGNQTAGPRKRYVICSKNKEVLRDLSSYFSTHMFAPSENDERKKLGAVGA